MVAELEAGRLLLDGRPHLILGGELHNSSGSTARSMATRWAGIVEAGCNTVLAPVPWEQFEPEEGRFDPTLVDELLAGARTAGLRLVLLWFGSWKNGSSMYVPPWVKRDPERFALQQLGGAMSTTLSPFSAANAIADARAFAAFMAHLRQCDTDRTVLMVQIENEVGSLGDSRDRSPLAEAAWRSPVPSALLDHIRDDPDGCRTSMRVTSNCAADATSNWVETFGEGETTDELFMAWHLASYIEQVAAAGRAEHDLPLYVNAWLDGSSEATAAAVSGGNRPGTYPSGGPLPHVAAAWHVAAPSLDFLSPDIYAPETDTWLQRYGAVTPVIFVPELHRNQRGLAAIFIAIGQHAAIGAAPFGIDELTEVERAHLRRGYQQLAAIADDVLEAQRSGNIRGFAVTADAPADIELDGYRFYVSPDAWFDGSDRRPDDGYGLLLSLGDGTFLVAGFSLIINARTASGGPTVLHTVQELDIEPRLSRSRDLPVLRWLNGDETLSGHCVRVTGDEVSPWPAGIPASPSVTGLVRFSLAARPQ